MPRRDNDIIKLLAENEALLRRLEEAEATLDAIRSGQVDALVGQGTNGNQIFTLQSADYSYRILVESMDQGALTLSPSGTILYCNRYFPLLVKTPSVNVIGSSISEYIHAEDKPDFAKWMRKKDKEKHHEFRLSKSDSDAIYVNISISPLQLDSADQVTSMIITDLTEAKQSEKIAAARKLAEQELIHERAARQRDKKLNTITKERSQLITMNKAKDEFISLASHQLRTPATAVKQYIGMILAGFAGDLTQQQRSFLETAYESNDRQLKIVDDLLKVARVDSGTIKLKRSDCDLVFLLKDIINEQLPKFKTFSQRLILDTKMKSAIVSIDGNLIRMALENIIDNAGKYSLHGQTITVTLTENKQWKIISVKDAGVGIDAADQDKLFHKFSRISNPLSVLVGGSGLGLYWTKKIIKLHGGSIELSSKLKHGSTFTVKLPAVK